MMKAPSVCVHDLTLTYRRHPAIHHLSGAFEAGSLTAIVGPNGAGKSTLLKGIVGALRPDSGRIHLDGVKRHDIGYLPQLSELDRSFPITVLDLVSLGAWRQIGTFRRLTGPGRDRTLACIAAVGLTGFEQRTINTLSGGQLQRALFARLMLQNARLLLLDEPFTGIDTRTTADLITLIKEWHGEGRTIIAVLHDMALVRDHFPSTLLIARKQIAWGATIDALAPGNLEASRRLSERWDDDAELCEVVAA
ncbi:zinc ABC transporter ATP-binding protein AztA [Rhizobium sullae]|uniref:Zinc/manganese transport system ATP-binding protein n=1 Tax=Rhizobium sullae TaxID=50338 RepID=A0A4R3Q9R9_RHISU|nr:zinc/manganese transport system ATP-binding protein [Rhizobium sullae]